MPYSISQGGGSCGDSEWAVLSDSGRTMGCHATKQEALDQQAALYVNDPDAKSSEIPAAQLPRGRMMAMRHTPTLGPGMTTRHITTDHRRAQRDRKP